MQLGPTSMESSPPSAPLPAASEAVADSPAEEPSAAAEAEEAQPAVKVEPPPPVQEGGEEADEPREESRGTRRRKRAWRGVSASSSRATAPASSAPAAGAGMGTVMVKRDLLARCLTCPLCHRLLRDATTISECLHTFCRKCIYEKFNDEEVEYCPVCKRNLGCTPVEKLRADHSLQDVRSNIFPFKRKKINAEEVPSPDSLPTKRKERSISSLVVNTPKVKPTSLTGRQTRAVARKAAAALRGLGPVIGDPVKKEIDSCDSQSQNPVFPANSGKAPQIRRQISSNIEMSNHSSNTNVEDNNEELADKGELWQPLNCLVEAANRTKSFRSSSQNMVVKGEQLNGSPSSTYATKTKAREHLQKSKTEDDKKDVPMPPIMLKKRVGTRRRRRQLQAPADAKSDAAATQNEKKFSSIWFSLVAFGKQGDPPLPQIPSHYLRIKDGNVPASSIQKYLMQKLSLPSESEVEIKCCEQPVNPTQPLCKLVELWLKGRSARTTQAMIGSSAKEFVMVLTYGRSKAPAL